MRFNVDRICELAGLGAASGGLLAEAAAVPPKPAAGPAKPAAPSAKMPPAPPAGTAKAAPAVKEMDDELDFLDEAEEEEEEEGSMYEMDSIEDNVYYEIDEMQLMEALVEMRQSRLEESAVRDTVRDEIRRALSEKGGSWIYGANKPRNSQPGQIFRGGFGIGFK